MGCDDYNGNIQRPDVQAAGLQVTYRKFKPPFSRCATVSRMYWSIRSRLPTMTGRAQFAVGGNLMSYDPSLREASGRLAYLVDRILKGAKPEQLIFVPLLAGQRHARIRIDDYH